MCDFVTYYRAITTIYFYHNMDGSSDIYDPGWSGFEPPQKITTMTAIVDFDGEIDIDTCFPLFNPIPQPTDSVPIKKKKMRPNLYTQAGDIISASYRGITLGMVSSKKDNDFENSIALNVFTGEKVVNVKLARTCAHISGAKSRKMAHTAVRFLINSLLHIQELLDWRMEQPEQSDEILRWIEAVTKGETLLYCTTPIKQKREVTPLLKTTLKIPTTENIPTHLYQPLVNYILATSAKCSDYNAYQAQLQWIYNLGNISIIEKPLSITKVRCVMVNFNYSLGFKVRRVALCKAIENSGSMFKARYSNIYNNSVTCTYPCQIEEGKPPRYCTLLIYVTGRVTQSGPNPEWGMFVYKEFILLIERIRQYIIYEHPENMIKVTWR